MKILRPFLDAVKQKSGQKALKGGLEGELKGEGILFTVEAFSDP